MIFGIASPKLIFNPGPEEEEVLLDYTIIKNNAPEYLYIEHESEIDGDRTYIKKGAHWLIELEMNLYKYPDPTYKYAQIVKYEGSEGTFYLHRDKDPFQDSLGVVVPFVLYSVIPFYKNHADYKDALLITLKSTRAVDKSKSLIGTLISEGGQNVTAEDEQQIIL